MGFFNFIKKRSPAAQNQPSSEVGNMTDAEYLNDITFIREIKHITAGPWHQYDVLLAARGYGWDMMKDWADYMSGADLEHISQVTIPEGQ